MKQKYWILPPFIKNVRIIFHYYTKEYEDEVRFLQLFLLYYRRIFWELDFNLMICKWTKEYRKGGTKKITLKKWILRWKQKYLSIDFAIPKLHHFKLQNKKNFASIYQFPEWYRGRCQCNDPCVWKLFGSAYSKRDFCSVLTRLSRCDCLDPLVWIYHHLWFGWICISQSVCNREVSSVLVTTAQRARR